MLNIEGLYQLLHNVASRHVNLKNKFNGFADSLSTYAKNPQAPIKGISVTHEQNSDFIIITFAGRQIYMSFTAVMSEGNNLVGRIISYLKVEFPTEKYLKLNQFDFKSNGFTNHQLPEELDQLDISEGVHAIQIALNIINESLSNKDGN